MPPERFIDRVETKLGRVYRAAKEGVRDLLRGFSDQELMETYRRAYGTLNAVDFTHFRHREASFTSMMLGSTTRVGMSTPEYSSPFLTPDSYDAIVESTNRLSVDELTRRIQLSARGQLKRWKI